MSKGLASNGATVLDFPGGDGGGSSRPSLLPNASQLLMSAARNNSKRKRDGDGAEGSKGKGAGGGGKGKGGTSQKVRRCSSRFRSFFLSYLSPSWFVIVFLSVIVSVSSSCPCLSVCLFLRLCVSVSTYFSVFIYVFSSVSFSLPPSLPSVFYLQHATPVSYF